HPLWATLERSAAGTDKKRASLARATESALATHLVGMQALSTQQTANRETESRAETRPGGRGGWSTGREGRSPVASVGADRRAAGTNKKRASLARATESALATHLVGMQALSTQQTANRETESRAETRPGG